MKHNTGIKVFAPATINGIGRLGKDVFGIALQEMGDEVIIKHSNQKGITIKEVYGGKGQVSKLAHENPASVAAQLLLKHLGRENEGVEMEIYKRIPLNSGLGSREASAVAGIIGMNEWLKRPLEKKDLLPIVLQMDINATHAAAALKGGMTLLKDNSTEKVQRISVPRGLFITITTTPLDFKLEYKEDLTLASNGKRLVELVIGLYNSDFETLNRVFQGLNTYKEDDFQFLTLQSHLQDLGALTSFVVNSTIITVSLNSLIAEKTSNYISKVLKEKKIRHKSVISNLLLEGAFKY